MFSVKEWFQHIGLQYLSKMSFLEKPMLVAGSQIQSLLYQVFYVLLTALGDLELQGYVLIFCPFKTSMYWPNNHHSDISKGIDREVYQKPQLVT